MKITENGVLTSGDLLKEFFTMSERMINNISEKVRYEKIYEYLVEEGAKREKHKYETDSGYNFFKLEEELYLIPNNIFDELDEEWQKELESKEESETEIIEDEEVNNNPKVAS